MWHSFYELEIFEKVVMQKYEILSDIILLINFLNSIAITFILSFNVYLQLQTMLLILKPIIKNIILSLSLYYALNRMASGSGISGNLESGNFVALQKSRGIS